MTELINYADTDVDVVTTALSGMNDTATLSIGLIDASVYALTGIDATAGIKREAEFAVSNAGTVTQQVFDAETHFKFKTSGTAIQLENLTSGDLTIKWVYEKRV